GVKINERRLLEKFNHYIPLNHIIDHISKIPANKKIITKQLKNQNPSQDEILMKIFKNKTFARISESMMWPWSTTVSWATAILLPCFVCFHHTMRLAPQRDA
ncbi:MAG: hypothetical protein AABZ22_08025, partial [Nitrospirota bacterium]